MKLYYKYDKYNCSIKTEKKNNLWYAFEPVKLKVSMPLHEYVKMSADIKDCGKELHFRLLVNKSDDHTCESIGKDGLWVIDSKVYSGTINSKYPDGNVEIIFRLSIVSSVEASKLEKKRLILDDLFKK